MRLATMLMAATLVCPAAARGADDPQRAETEVTLVPRTQLTSGLTFGGPLGFSAAVGVLRGLGADVDQDSDHVTTVCAFPTWHCRHGFLVMGEAGSGGGKLSLGLGGLAHVDSDDFHGTAGLDFKISVARTWGSPIGTDPGLTYVGPELEFSVVHVGLGFGVLRRVAGRTGSSTLFTWGVGLRL